MRVVRALLGRTGMRCSHSVSMVVVLAAGCGGRANNGVHDGGIDGPRAAAVDGAGGPTEGGRDSGDDRPSAASPDGPAVDARPDLGDDRPPAPRDAVPLTCQGRDGALPSFDKSCATDSDCIVMAHQPGCCGFYVVAINAREVPRFQAAQAECRMPCPSCHGLVSSMVEDGSYLAPEPVATSPAAVCQQGQCRSFVKECGEPCGGTSRCMSCGQYFTCSTYCASDSDCRDPQRPKCQPNSTGGPGFCTAASAVCCTDGDLGRADTKGVTTAPNGVFEDRCDSAGNLVEHTCSARGEGSSQALDCSGWCDDGACPARCPAHGDLLTYASVDAAGGAHFRSADDPRTYACTLRLDNMRDTHDCIRDVMPGQQVKVLTLGIDPTVPGQCTGGAFGSFGTGPVTAAAQAEARCTYVCAFAPKN